MKIVIFAAALLLAGCVSPSLSQRNDMKSTSTSTGNFSRDASECEREAALSNAGSKAQAFDRCMRARNYTPSRQ